MRTRPALLVHAPLTTAVAGAALALAACGSGPGNERATGAAADVRATPAPRVSTAQYAKRAAALKTAIDDARSRYFHGNGSPKAVMGQLRNVRAAYSDAAERLAAIEPPQAATELHTKLVALWRKRTSQVAKLLGARRYRSSRVSDLMYATDADNTLYNDIYTLPH